MTHLRLSPSHTLPGSLEPLSHHSFRCCLLSPPGDFSTLVFFRSVVVSVSSRQVAVTKSDPFLPFVEV